MEVWDAEYPRMHVVALNIGRILPQNADNPDEKYCRNAENLSALT